MRQFSYACTFLSILLSTTSCSNEDTKIQVRKVPKSFKATLPLSRVNEGSARLQWSTPSTWVSEGALGMRAASFKAENGAVDVSLTFLQGDAGGALANVNRWKGQHGLPPWSEEEFVRERSVLTTQLGEATQVSFFNAEEVGVRGVLIPYQQGTWFVKMVGDKKKLEKEQKHFLQFVLSLKGLNP